MKALRFASARNLISAVVFVFLFISVVSVQSVYAQADKSGMPAREMLNVTVVSVRPDMVMDFENLIKTEYNPAFIKGGGKSSEVWQTASFGTAYEYIFVQPVEKFAQIDGPSYLMKGAGAEGVKSFLGKVGKMVNGVRSFVIQTRPDMSFTNKMEGPPNIVVVSHVQVAQGRAGEFENFILNEWVPTVKRSGISGYWVSQVMFGGNVNEFITLTPQANWAELDKGPPIVRVLGAEGATKLMAKLPNGVVTNLERYISRFNKELSVMPAAK